MVVAQEPLAADVGLAVLKAGGNAVDAAVAVGFALAVTHPFAGNLGGGGFMLIRLADGTRPSSTSARRRPQAATRDMYLGPDGKPTRDSLDGLARFRRARLGARLRVRPQEVRQEVLGRAIVQPAVELADKGFPVSYALAESLQGRRQAARAVRRNRKRIFLKDGELL